MGLETRCKFPNSKNFHRCKNKTVWLTENERAPVCRSHLYPVQPLTPLRAVLHTMILEEISYAAVFNFLRHIPSTTPLEYIFDIVLQNNPDHWDSFSSALQEHLKDLASQSKLSSSQMDWMVQNGYAKYPWSWSQLCCGRRRNTKKEDDDMSKKHLLTVKLLEPLDDDAWSASLPKEQAKL